MFRIKICGITRMEDAVTAGAAGADAIGFNFTKNSPRAVLPEVARSISEQIGPGVLRIGVFVNSDPEEIAAIAQAVPLQAIQLHGDETPETLARLPADLAILRAYRMTEVGLAPLVQYIAQANRAGRGPDAVLVDAHSPEAYGGTGRTVNWDQLGRQRELLGHLPLLLAGGLTEGNVAEAILSVHPDGVDTASGVEVAPGRKDPQLIQRFVATAREAFSPRPGG